MFATVVKDTLVLVAVLVVHNAVAVLEAGDQEARVAVLGADAEAVVHKRLVVKPRADEDLTTAHAQHAATFALAVDKFAFVAMAIAEREQAGAVRLAVGKHALERVAVVEQKAAAARHAILVPLADVLDAAIARQHGHVAEHHAAHATQPIAGHGERAARAVRQKARAVAVLLVVRERALVDVAAAVHEATAALLTAIRGPIAHVLLLAPTTIALTNIRRAQQHATAQHKHIATTSGRDHNS